MEVHDVNEPPEKVLFSMAEENYNLKHLSGSPTFDPLDCMGKHMVFNENDHLKGLGDTIYAVELGEDQEDIFYP